MAPVRAVVVHRDGARRRVDGIDDVRAVPDDHTLDERTASLASDGFVGRFLSEPVAGGPRPAVLVIGGSEGGMDTFLAAMLAVRGYPALAVAYFGEPGLPPALSAIPLEYFEGALKWLAAQPGVDPTRIVVYGGSRGSEAAELLGVHDADQVHGVIGGSPSNVAGCSLTACVGPAWTLGGVAVPYTHTWTTPPRRTTRAP